MNLKTKILFGIVVLGLVLASMWFILNQSPSEEERPKVTEPLQLTIQSDKEVYEMGESIYIDYQITNVGDKEITIAPPFSDEGVIDSHVFGGSFVIKNKLNENLIEVFPLADIQWGISDKTITLKNGESFNKKVNIIRIDEKSNLRDIVYTSDYLQKSSGIYEITGKYEWSKLRGNYPIPNCWKGSLTSNTITIKIE